RTQRRNVSAVQPILAAIEQIAAHSDSWSSWCSTTSRTARSRTSGEYFVDDFMAPSSQELEPPGKPGRFTATYVYADFKRDILSVLEAQYGQAVHVGAKAIAIDASGTRRKADVIVATAFRR